MPNSDEGLKAMQEQARERVKWLHHEAGIPVRQLAIRFNTSPSRVSNWVNEHQYPSRMSCERIERLFLEEKAKRDSAS